MNPMRLRADIWTRRAIAWLVLVAWVDATQPDTLLAQVRPVPERITLGEALSEALASNPTLLASGNATEIARAEVGFQTARLLPLVEVGTGYTRSVDPVFAFGTRLRQERFAESDFAIDALNRPDATDDWTMQIGLRWNVVDPTARAARSAAKFRADASVSEEAWSRRRTVYLTRVLYYSAVGAQARLEVAEAEEASAFATLDQFGRRREEGLLTEADLLAAEAELRRAEAMRIAADRDVRQAREELALHLGRGIERPPVPVDTLRTWAPSQPGDPGDLAGARPDLRALAARVEAAGADARAAGRALLPTIDGFASWSNHARRAFSPDGSDWTVGVSLRWTAFAGFGRVAARRRAEAAAEIARLHEREAVRRAHAEEVQAFRDVTAARDGLDATRAASRAADEARELTKRRFEEGLSTAAELLQSEARAAGARGREVESLVRLNIAVARLELFSGSPGPARDSLPSIGRTFERIP